MKWIILLGILVYVFTQTKVTTTHSNPNYNHPEKIVKETAEKIVNNTVSQIGKNLNERAKLENLVKGN